MPWFVIIVWYDHQIPDNSRLKSCTVFNDVTILIVFILFMLVGVDEVAIEISSFPKHAGFTGV